MIAVAALCGALVAAGVVAMSVGFNSHSPISPLFSTRLWKRSVETVVTRRWLLPLSAALVGLVVATLTGWWLLAVIVPAVAVVLPLLLSAPSNRELHLLQAVDRWVRTLGSLLSTGRSISDAIRISTRHAPALLAPSLQRLRLRMDERWTTEQALLAMADELSSADADAVLAALSLAAQRGGTGAAATLHALADNLQDRLRALREIDTERAKPRFVVRQVTLITTVALGLALLFGGSFFAPFGTPIGQLLLAILVSAYLGSLAFLRTMTLPRTRRRILARPS